MIDYRDARLVHRGQRRYAAIRKDGLRQVDVGAHRGIGGLRGRMEVEVVAVKTVILGPRPPELEALIERRHALGQDLYDEVWEGEYHMAPMAHSSHGILDQLLAELLGPLASARGLTMTGPLNLGEKDDFRVPDRAVHRTLPRGSFPSTAAVVIEILSRHDETFAKFGFYAVHGVEEILVVDAATRSVRCWALDGVEYRPATASAVLGAGCEALAAQLDWPDPDKD
jgi:Putative restriction endonuclease